MIIVSPELSEFKVEPWMKLEPFDPKLIKKITPNHPYKILLSYFFKYSPSYNNEEKKDANPYLDGYSDNIVDIYFGMLNDYKRYGIAFHRESRLFPDNKLCVFKDKLPIKTYYLVRNSYDDDINILLFNNVKTIDLNDYDGGEKPLSEEEEQKIDIIKKLKNKKLKAAIMDPDIFNYSKNFNEAVENPRFQNNLIKRFNYRMTYEGLSDFMSQKYD